MEKGDQYPLCHADSAPQSRPAPATRRIVLTIFEKDDICLAKDHTAIPAAASSIPQASPVKATADDILTSASLHIRHTGTMPAGAERIPYQACDQKDDCA